MKKVKLLVLILAVVVCTGVINLSAKEGEIDDNYVHYIYWDRYDWNVFYTGVTNKLTYQRYKPCGGVVDSEYQCGQYAAYSEYKEYGLSIQQGYQHIHALGNADGYFDYVIR